MNLYMGFQFAAVANWEEIIPAPTPPKHYKDPVKKKEYVEKAIASMANGLNTVDVRCGYIEGVEILHKDGKKNKLVPYWDPKRYAQFSTALDAVHSTFEDPPVIEAMKQKRLSVFGFDIHRAMRLAAIDWMAQGETMSFSKQFMLDLDEDFRYNRFPGFIDPLKLIFGTTTELETACRRLQIGPAAESATGRATLAFEMAKMMGF